jgi:hypothetical protein
MTLTTWWNNEYKPFDYQSKSMPISDYMPKEFEELFIHNCALNSSA